jgi:hypothetical protein
VTDTATEQTPFTPAQQALYDVLRQNAAYIGAELAAGRWTGLRFLRWRPERELRDTLNIAEAHARARAEAHNEELAAAGERELDVETVIAQDAVVDTLREAVRIHAPAAHTSPCPRGYQQPPYPLTVQHREDLYAETSRILPDVLPRHLPGGPDGWSWRVEPQVTADASALILRLTPRNERFEDPIVHGQTPEEQASGIESGEPPTT